jgi:hypothetical protein
MRNATRDAGSTRQQFRPGTAIGAEAPGTLLSVEKVRCIRLPSFGLQGVCLKRTDNGHCSTVSK